MKNIAHIETDFPEKFGIPRQSGLANELRGRIVFEKEFRNPDAVRGLEDFAYIWLLWKFQDVDCKRSEGWSATVRPPRLGGNVRKGVFATRSPFRPNPIGLSSVRLEKIEFTDRGPILYVVGADLRDGTPIYDIKPYLRYVDSHEDANDGFAEEGQGHLLQVEISDEIWEDFPEEKRAALKEVLALDPRPSYHNNAEKKYGISFAGYNISFQVDADILRVTKVSKIF